MIDTIRLRFYGILDTYQCTFDIVSNKNQGISNFAIPEHHELYKCIKKKKGEYFSMMVVSKKQKNTLENLTEDEYLMLENSKNLNSFYQLKNIIRFVDEDKEKEIIARTSGKWRVPSSNSNVTFQINEEGSYIDFEFSIPKYLYGHSLAEFIPQGNSNLAFWLHDIQSWSSQGSVLYKRLMKFIDKFFIDLCTYFKIDMLPNKKYIELRRIDLCYNQHFETKELAEMYLENQKKLAKNKETATTNKAEIYKTSLTYVMSNGSYFKIYMKGAEYSQSDGDLKKHLKLNQMYMDKMEKTLEAKQVYHDNRDYISMVFEKKARGEDLTIIKEKENLIPLINKIAKEVPFKTGFLKKEMDKVLRYEVSLRGDFFRNIYKKKIFRKNDEEHIKAKTIHKEVHKHFYNLLEKKDKISKRELQVYKMMEKHYGTQVSLILGEIMELKHYEKSSFSDMINGVYKLNESRPRHPHTILQDRDCAVFSDEILKHCINHFYDLINRFEIKKLEKFDSISHKIATYNENVERNRNEYNEQYSYLCFENVLETKVNQFGQIEYTEIRKYKQKGNKIITKPTQLLTQAELREKNLQKVNPNILLMLLEQIKKGESLSSFQHKHKINKSTMSRYRADCKKFGIFENTLELEMNVDVRKDFQHYYSNIQSRDYREKFYPQEIMFKYG